MNTRSCPRRAHKCLACAPRMSRATTTVLLGCNITTLGIVDVWCWALLGAAFQRSRWLELTKQFCARGHFWRVRADCGSGRRTPRAELLLMAASVVPLPKECQSHQRGATGLCYTFTMACGVFQMACDMFAAGQNTFMADPRGIQYLNCVCYWRAATCCYL